MKPTQSPIDLSSRLRHAVERRYPGRGRYAALERESGINADRWKNFYYGRQSATEEIRSFWFAMFPEEREWIETGLAPALAAMLMTLPHDTSSVRDRVIWLVNRIGGSPLRYKTVEATLGVSHRKWQNVCNEAQQPSIEMLEAIAACYPFLSEWLLTGRIPRFGDTVAAQLPCPPASLASIGALVSALSTDVERLQQAFSQLAVTDSTTG